MRKTMDANCRSVLTLSYTDIYLVGGGILFPQHLTLEALHVLKECKEIHSWLDSDRLKHLPDDLCTKCFSHFVSGDQCDYRHHDVVGEIAKRLMQESPVAWLSTGHPMICDTVASGLREFGERNQLVVKTIAGISTLDSLLATVGLEVSEGVQVYDAPSLLKKQLLPVTSVPALLLQPALIPKNGDMSRTARFLLKLCKFLCRAYPADHPCTIAWSADSPSSVSWTKTVALADLPTIWTDSMRGFSMLLPPF